MDLGDGLLLAGQAYLDRHPTLSDSSYLSPFDLPESWLSESTEVETPSLRPTLLPRVWQLPLSERRGIDAAILTRSVDIMISRLRGKLGDSVKPPRFIQTIWGRGYSVVGVPLPDA